jgi:putative transposase
MMARLPRNVVPGQALHIIQRGNNRQAVFFAVADYRFYHECLCKAATRYGCAVHAYVFMTNHVHLLMTPTTESGPAKFMQSVGRRYVRYINAVYGRTGTLWEGRYKSSIIDTERYLMACSRYIELNPVRAAMVGHPREYFWSSYRANAVDGSDVLITPHELYERLGAGDIERRHCYAALFDGLIDEALLSKIRSATETGAVMGNDRFREEVAEALKRRVDKSTLGGDRKSKDFRGGGGSSTLTP